MCVLMYHKLKIMGFPGGSVAKNLSANAGEAGSHPWVGKIPWRRKWQPTVATHSILAWRIPWTRGSWQATVHGVAKTIRQYLATKQQQQTKNKPLKTGSKQ